MSTQTPTLQNIVAQAVLFALPSWKELQQIAQSHTPARRVRRPGQSPSTAPIPGSLANLAPGEKPIGLPATRAPQRDAIVLLYRDTNSWCPFCERVWLALEEKGIPFETEFIDLSNKPKWYTDLVPTGLVPAARIDGRLIYESKDILLALEERFPAPSLLPEDRQEQAVAQQWIEESETNGFLAASYKFLRGSTEAANELEAIQADLEAKLDSLEQQLARYEGSYFLTTFSLVDILYSPHLDRLAANAPVYRGYTLKGNPRFPRLNAWYDAIKQRPAYQRVKSDDITNNLLLHRRWGLEPIANLPLLDQSEAEALHNRAEAAERLSDNHEAAIGDILKNSGVQGLAASVDIAVIQEAIDWHLRLLAAHLLGHNDRLPWGRVGGKDDFDPSVAAVGAITLAYVRNRICAPRDMSAGAATALRYAVDAVLTSLY